MGAREEFMANMTELGTMETEMLLYLYGFFFLFLERERTSSRNSSSHGLGRHERT